MVELVVDEQREHIGIILPDGMTVGKMTHMKPGSHGTMDPSDLREHVVIRLKKRTE